MSPTMFNLVFPDGTSEYRSHPRAPVVGHMLNHLGEDFVVDTVDSDDTGNVVVRVRHQEPDIRTD